MTLVDHILGFNPQIQNMDLIKVSQKIEIPGINEECFLTGTPGNGYKIHLGTFDDAHSTARYQGESSLRGKNIEVIPRKVSPDTTWYRLVAGNFESREEIMRALQDLKQKGLLPAFYNGG